MGNVRAYIGLGSNVGDSEATLEGAVNALGDLSGTHLAGVSRLYVTTPVGVTDQPMFRNAVVALDTRGGRDPAAGAISLLVTLKSIERSFGRRQGQRWGPRELDLDLLVYGRHRIDVERPPEGSSLDAAHATRALVVPHPEARDRLFVLAPLVDLAPRLVPPGWGETVLGAYRRRIAIEGPDAARPIARWDAAGGCWSGAEEAGL